MAQSTVEQFAKELNKDVTDLLEQFKAAGVRKKAAEDKVTEEDKTKLLEYLRELHGHKEEKKKKQEDSPTYPSRQKGRVLDPYHLGNTTLNGIYQPQFHVNQGFYFQIACFFKYIR